MEIPFSNFSYPRQVRFQLIEWVHPAFYYAPFCGGALTVLSCKQ
jgi:hypothetical protein